MSDTTTVKLPPRIKRRIAPLARAAGKSPHAWMVDALVDQVEQEELRQEFVAGALESRTAVSEGEPVYAADDVLAWLRARATGQKARRPAGRATPR